MTRALEEMTRWVDEMAWRVVDGAILYGAP
jgi:hypothetical protein